MQLPATTPIPGQPEAPGTATPVVAAGGEPAGPATAFAALLAALGEAALPGTPLPDAEGGATSPAHTDQAGGEDDGTTTDSSDQDAALAGAAAAALVAAAAAAPAPVAAPAAAGTATEASTPPPAAAPSATGSPPAEAAATPVPEGPTVAEGASAPAQATATGAPTPVATSEGGELGGRGQDQVVVEDGGPGGDGHGETRTHRATGRKHAPSAPSPLPSEKSAAAPTTAAAARRVAERQLEQAVGQAGAAAAGPARATIAERNAAAPRAGTPPPAHEGPATAVAAVAEPGTLQSGADRGAGGPAGDGAEHAPLQAASQPEPAQLVPAHGRGVAADSAPAVPARSVEPPLRDLEQLVALDQAHRPLHVRDTGGEMRVSVEPAGMGSVELRVSVQADAVHASFTASHEATRDALAQHRPQLEAALQRSQLKLEGFTVGLGQQHQPRDPGGQPDGRFLPPGGVPPGRPIDPVTVAPAPVPVTRGPGALSLRA